jgi:hypothetical protein
MAKFSGVWLPIITPFLDGEVDDSSYARLVEHYDLLLRLSCSCGTAPIALSCGVHR